MELIDFEELAKKMTLSDFEEYAKTMPNIDRLCDEIEKVSRNGKTKKFKDYYADPEFRKKHQDRLQVLVKCPKCDFETSKCNLKRHLKSKNCKNRIERSKQGKITLKEIILLQKKLDKAIELLQDK